MQEPSIIVKICQVIGLSDDEINGYESLFNEFVLRIALFSLIETVTPEEKQELKDVVEKKMPLPNKYLPALQEAGKAASKDAFKDFLSQIYTKCTEEEKSKINEVINHNYTV